MRKSPSAIFLDIHPLSRITSISLERGRRTFSDSSLS